jgi:hypothetical protein
MDLREQKSTCKLSQKTVMKSRSGGLELAETRGHELGPVAQLLKQRKSVLRAGALHDVRESLVPKNMPVKLNCVQRLRHTVGRVEVGLDVANLELARKVEGSDVVKLDLDVLSPLEKSGSRRQLDSALIVHLEQRSNTRIHNL